MAGNKKEELQPRSQTLRQEIIEQLKESELSLREISKALHISENDALSHLDHIKKSASKSGYSLKVSPAQCKNCGYIFKKRDKLKKPGKCPVCKNTFILPQLFSLKKVK